MNFTTLWNKHRFLYIGILWVSAAMGTLMAPSLTVQLIVAAGGVGLIGIAHGAIDYRFGRKLLEPGWGWVWFLVFVGLYLSFGFGMFSIWIWNPRLALFVFLLLAVPHFGFEDVVSKRYSSLTSIVFALGLGTLPIALPSYFSTDQTTTVFNMLLPVEQHLHQSSVLMVSWVVLIASLSAIFVSGILEFGRTVSQPTEIITFFVECISLIVMFTLVTPILGFTIYYCFGHSMREMIEITDELYTGPVWNRVTQFAREVSPIVVSTLIIASMAWYVMTDYHLPPSSILAIVVFVGLNLVFIPHMVFDVWHEYSSV